LPLSFLQGLGVDFHGVFYLDLHPGLGQHVGDLEHAGGAAGGHHLAAGGGDVVPLAVADGRRGLVVLEPVGRESEAYPAFSIYFGQKFPA
jgi:hypothetical protein